MKYIEGDPCPDCGEPLHYDEGQDQSFHEPHIAPCVYCIHCGAELDLDPDRMPERACESECAYPEACRCKDPRGTAARLEPELVPLEASPGDARCNFCDGPMPCYCPDPLSPAEREKATQKTIDDWAKYGDLLEERG